VASKTRNQSTAKSAKRASAVARSASKTRAASKTKAPARKEPRGAVAKSHKATAKPSSSKSSKNIRSEMPVNSKTAKTAGAKGTASKVASAKTVASKPHEAKVAPVKAPVAAKAAPVAKPHVEKGHLDKAHLDKAHQAPAPAAKVAAKAAAPVAARPEEPKKPLTQRQGFKTNEFVVYPAHGVGQILSIEEQEIAGAKLELFVINFIKDKMTLRVPTAKVAQVGMRKLSEPALVKKALETLKGRARIKRTMWSRRAQEYEAKINSGDIVAIAEVVRDLYRSESQPEQSYSERQLYEAALDRLSREIAVVQHVTETEAVKEIEASLAKSPRRGAVKAEAEGEADAEGEDDTDEGEDDSVAEDEAA